MTLDELQAHLDRLDDGVLRSGSHQAGGREFCALEFKSQVDGIEWTDNPELTGFPDIRPLNDARWSSDKVRTEALLPLMVALWGYATWSSARKQKYLELVIVETTAQIVAEMPFFVKTRIEKPQITTLAEVRLWAKDAADDAAYAANAAAYAAYAAAYAANAAAYAADAAAYAANAAVYAAYAANAADAAAYAYAAGTILQLACQIWIQAVTATEGL